MRSFSIYLFNFSVRCTPDCHHDWSSWLGRRTLRIANERYLGQVDEDMLSREIDASMQEASAVEGAHRSCARARRASHSAGPPGGASQEGGSRSRAVLRRGPRASAYLQQQLEQGPSLSTAAIRLKAQPNHRRQSGQGLTSC